MWRVVIFLVGAEIGGGWLLASIFELRPIVAYVAMTGALSAFVAIFILLTAPQDPDLP